MTSWIEFRKIAERNGETVYRERTAGEPPTEAVFTSELTLAQLNELKETIDWMERAGLLIKVTPGCETVDAEAVVDQSLKPKN